MFHSSRRWAPSNHIHWLRPHPAVSALELGLTLALMVLYSAIGGTVGVAVSVDTGSRSLRCMLYLGPTPSRESPCFEIAARPSVIASRRLVSHAVHRGPFSGGWMVQGAYWNSGSVGEDGQAASTPLGRAGQLRGVAHVDGAPRRLIALSGAGCGSPTHSPTPTTIEASGRAGGRRGARKGGV